MPLLRVHHLDNRPVSPGISGSPGLSAHGGSRAGAYVQGKAVSDHETAILRAVAYASIFDFPLSAEELRRTLTRRSSSIGALRRDIEHSPFLRSRIECVDGCYVLAGRADLIDRRRSREAHSRAFLSAHKRTLDMICMMPFTRLVAISGSLAHLNADADADLDLFVITRGPHVWTVALLLVVMAKVIGRRNVVCANFVIADSHMTLDQSDLYTASQVLHLRPVAGAAGYDEFLAANPFVRRTFPNAADQPAAPFPLPRAGALRALKPFLEAVLWLLPSGLLEHVCRRAYGWHLRRKVSRWRSPDQVRMERCCLKLHTNSHRRAVLDRLDRIVDESTAATAPARPRSDAC